MQKVFSPDFQQISCLVKREPNGVICRDQAIYFLEDYVSGILAYFGAKWDDDQITLIAKDIFREFYFFNQADMRIFLNRLRAMEINDYVFTPRKLMNELIKYRDERLQEAEIKSQSEKNRLDREHKQKYPDEKRDLVARNVEAAHTFKEVLQPSKMQRLQDRVEKQQQIIDRYYDREE